MSGREVRTRHVHIVIGGGRDEHVGVGLSKLECDSFHVITSPDFEEQFSSRMAEWAEEFGIEQGSLTIIDSEALFSETAEERIREAMLGICKAEGVPFPLMQDGSVPTSGDGIPCRFMINITGGTNLMGGVAVHVAGLIGATPYYVVRDDAGESVPLTFPSMAITSLLSKHNPGPMKELLKKPSGRVDDLALAGSLILELCECGFATIQPEGLHYEISEEAKRLMWQITQTRLSQGKGGASGTAELLGLGKGLGKLKEEGRREDEEFVSGLAKLPFEKCSNPVYVAFLEEKDLEGRAEIWEGKKECRLRLCFCRSGEGDGGDSWDPDGKSSIERFSEKWYDVDSVTRFLLSAGFSVEFAKSKEGKASARALSGGNDMVMFALRARKYFEHLDFKVPGSLGGPVSD